MSSSQFTSSRAGLRAPRPSARSPRLQMDGHIRGSNNGNTAKGYDSASDVSNSGSKAESDSSWSEGAASASDTGSDLEQGLSKKCRKTSPSSTVPKQASKAKKPKAKSSSQSTQPRHNVTTGKKKGPLSPNPSPINENDEDEDISVAAGIQDEEEVQDVPYTSGAIYNDKYQCRDGIANDKPLATLKEMFGHMTETALSRGFDEALFRFENRSLRVATMCSGTESPILAANMITQHLRTIAAEFLLHFQHVFSAEIVPHKQDYIQRNFGPPIIFRDITELSKKLDTCGKLQATTAHGGKADVPRDIDLLIAGFCCVDFSSLNNNRKTLEDLGESGDTFFAMLAYADDARPKIIILENVLNAPWVEKKTKGKKGEKISITTHLNRIGYSCVYIKADTKDFYLPHTRQRGYMICIDNRLPGMSETECGEKLAECKEHFNSMKCPASIPVEDMLLRHDDSVLRANTREVNAASGKIVEWDKCQVGHEEYRQQLGLGNKRPVTNWQPDGSNKLPDYFIKFPGLKARVEDVIDIAHLRGIKRGYDDRYYNRCLEASQNVYRVTDTTKLGIIGCLTPTGMPFSTYGGRLITGYETMKLQGLPVEQLDLDQLTDAQLRDLAGNAMSSTVVGAVILATLIVFPDIFNLEDREKVAEKVIVPELVDEDNLVPRVSNPGQYVPTTIAEIKKLALLTNRICYCEGRYSITTAELHQCRVCRHTICVEHGGNPKHHYDKICNDRVKIRQDPAKFEEMVKKVLPSNICFSGSLDVHAYLAEFSKVYKDDSRESTAVGKATMCIQAALLSEVHFKGVERSEIWKVQYESSAAKLTLVISSASVQWLLYAKPLTDLACSHSLRTFFKMHPIAYMKPSGPGADLMHGGSWSFWVPEERKFQATITSFGNLEQSFQAERGIDQYAGSSVFNKCKISISHYEDKYFDVDIRGDYEHSRHCAQAFNSLHCKVPSVGEPLFFYLEHERQTGNPKLHSFIFTHDSRRLLHGEDRPTVARVHCSWRQPMVRPGEVKTEQIDSTIIIAHGYWSKIEDFSFAERSDHKVTFCPLPKDVSGLQSLDCTLQHALFTCKCKVEANASFPTDKWVVVDRTNELDVFHQYGWILEKCKVLEGHFLSGLKDIDRWHPTNDDSGNRCITCAPLDPSLLWGFGKKKGKKLPKQVAFEVPTEATVFEKGLKSRPHPIKTWFRITRDGTIELKLGFNPLTLCHRASSILPVLPDPSPDTETSWWLSTDESTHSTDRLASFELLDTKNEGLASQPPGLSDNCRLRPEQLRKLAWMEAQEEGIIFTEREFVEHRQHQLGYHLVGQAKRDRIVRGGILADEVGFGKTILILAMIMVNRKADEEFASKPIRGRIPCKGTVIFVPPQLTKQWKEEANKFFRSTTSGKILLIERMADLLKLSIADFQKALIIIVNWDLCETEKYQLALAHLGGMVEPAKNATARAKAAWHKAVVRQIELNVDAGMKEPYKFAALLHSQFKQNVIQARSNNLPVPSKRVTGAEYQKVNKKRSFDQMQQGDDHCEKLEPRPDNHNLRNLGRGGFKSLKGPVFEMFHFARRVVDEFTYIETGLSLTLMRSLANVYWALSGTPPKEGFHDIKHMAEFLHIYLGAHDFFSMKHDIYTKVTRDMTASEKLLTFQSRPSDAWLRLRHDHAGRFLDAFVRRDIPAIPHIDYNPTIHLIRQTPQQSVIYSELEHMVVTKNFDLKGASSNDVYMNEILNGTTHGREALLLCASYDSMLSASRLKHTTVWKAFAIIMDERFFESQITLDEWARLMDIVVWLQHQAVNRGSSSLKDFLIRVQNNCYGDWEATQDLCEAANIAILDYHPDNVNYFQYLIEDPEAAFKRIRIELAKLAQEYVDRVRPCRFMESIQAINYRLNGCHGCRKRFIDPENWVVLSSCGHKICKEPCKEPCENRCKERSQQPCEDPCRPCARSDDGICPVDGCGILYQPYQKIPGVELAGPLASAREDEEVATLPLPYTLSSKGEKFRQITSLINKDCYFDDQFLVFVQSQPLRQQLLEALNAADISYTDLKSTGLLSSKLTKFQHNTRGQRDKCLILNIGDSSAAGANLTMANHIVFVAPYLTAGSRAQHDYDAARTQAIGRAWRYGQKKVVHVHDFVTVNTIDVDIIEKRNSKVLDVFTEADKTPSNLDSTNYSALGVLRDPQPRRQNKLGSRIAHLIFPAGKDA